MHLGMELIKNDYVRKKIMEAAGQGVQAVVAVITPYILPLLSELGVAAFAVAPFAMPVLIAGIAVWLIAELAD